MVMKKSQYPYQYTNFKHRQLIAEWINENIIIAHLVVWTRQAIEFNRIKYDKRWEIRQNSAVILALSISYTI